jgi:hypothetical protein
MKQSAIFAIAFFLSGLAGLQAQTPDTLPPPPVPEADTSIVVGKKEKVSDFPNPKKALLFSIIPGGGQIYNKRWWKLPFVYGAMGGMGYLINYNQGRYIRLRDALDRKRRDEPHEFTGTRLDDVQTLRNLRDEFDKNMQLSYVGFVLVYALQGMEAFVDAHLRSFDIDDNLSMRIKPSMQINSLNGLPAPGIGLSLQLSPPTPVKPRDFFGVNGDW